MRSEEDDRRLLKLLRTERDYLKYNHMYSLFPEEGPFRRSLYPKHMEHFGKHRRERCFMAANRVGKTIAGTFEVVLHCTGEYDRFPWWPGKRFNGPTEWFCAGKSNETTRDIIQAELLGKPKKGAMISDRDHGTGMIPKRLLVGTTNRQGVADMKDSIFIQHVSGGQSTINLKSYAQGRSAFEGTARNIWFDEEPDVHSYGEALMRTMTVSEGGILILTFTPLEGISEVVLSFMPGGKPLGD